MLLFFRDFVKALTVSVCWPIVNLKAIFTSRFRSRLAGAGLTILCGLGLWNSRVGDGFAHLSYDLPFIFNPKEDCDEIVIIKMDEQAYRELKQKWEKRW